MCMSDKDVGQSVGECWSVGRQRGVFLVDVNDWGSASRDSVMQRALAVTRELMSTESRLLDLLASPKVVTGSWRSGHSPSVRASTCKVVGAVANCEQFDPVLGGRGGERHESFSETLDVSLGQGSDCTRSPAGRSKCHRRSGV